MLTHPDLLRAVSAPCLLGESPFWHPREQALYWCDIAGRQLHRLDPESGASNAWTFASEPACCAPSLDGGLLLGMRDGLWHFDPRTQALDRLAKPPYDPAVERFNDGKCDAQGRFWLGTIYEPKDQPKASLYCWDGQQLHRRADGVTTANGLAWSLDSRSLYWADTKAHAILAFDFDAEAGTLSHRRAFAQMPLRTPGQPLDTYGGRPDGAAVDAEGCYWVAMYEGQQLVRLSPSGELLEACELPVRCPTMPCFGGDDLKTLYITTARQGRPAEELQRQPLAGCVLAVPVDVAGLPVQFASG